MLAVNITPFRSVTKRKRYAVNWQYLKSFCGNRAPLRQRTECVLRPFSSKTSRVPAYETLLFVCTLKEHEHRFCVSKENPLRVTAHDLIQNNRGTGNILTEIQKGRCHKCGDSDSHCWVEHTGHLVCTTCVSAKKGVNPYPFSHLGEKCCLKEDGCGSALVFFSDTPEEVRRKAINSFERFEKR